MIKKYLLIMGALLIPLVPVNGFALSIDLSLFTGDLSLLDLLFLVALGFVLIGTLLLCIAFLKPEKALVQENVELLFNEKAAEDSLEEDAEADASEPAVEEAEEKNEEDAEGSEEENPRPEEVSQDTFFNEADAEEEEVTDFAAPAAEPEAEPEKPIEKITITLTGVKNGELKILPVIDRALIGRSMKNDVVIADATVSGIHCEFIYKDGKAYLRDRNSTNGTYLNNERIFDDTEVHKGDILTIGQSEFKIGI